MPDREFPAPAEIRCFTCNPVQPSILFVGFHSGDVRLLIDNEWSQSHKEIFKIIPLSD